MDEDNNEAKNFDLHSQDDEQQKLLLNKDSDNED